MGNPEAEAKPKEANKEENLDDMKKELEWDEHKIPIEELAARLRTSLDKGELTHVQSLIHTWEIPIEELVAKLRTSLG